MAEIWELERDIRDRDDVKERLGRVLWNLKMLREEANSLASNIDNNLAIDDNGIPSARKARQISSDLGGYIEYIENCIIPHLQWDIDQARIDMKTSKTRNKIPTIKSIEE